MKNLDCIFCKIANKQINSNVIYEDKYVIAFLDLAEDFYGHTLVIPKKHVQDVLHATKKDLDYCYRAIRKICAHYETLGFNAFTIFNNCNDSSEHVMHLHFHIIPQNNEVNKQVINEPKIKRNLAEELNKLKLN